jgi:hypothetical protein
MEAIGCKNVTINFELETLFLKRCEKIAHLFAWLKITIQLIGINDVRW